MYTGNKSKPVAVWIFTYHDNGKLNVTQTVVDKEQFGKVQKGMKAIGKWIRDNLKAGDKCPYSPVNPAVCNDDMGPNGPFNEGGTNG